MTSSTAAYFRRYRRDHPDKVRAWRRNRKDKAYQSDWRWARKFGLTVVEYRALAPDVRKAMKLARKAAMKAARPPKPRVTPSKNNTSGRVGVSWFKPTGKYRATIKVDGHQISLGYFDDFEAARAARAAAEREYGFHENHGKVRSA